MILALAAVPFVVLVEQLGCAELVEAVVQGDLLVGVLLFRGVAINELGLAHSG